MDVCQVAFGWETARLEQLQRLPLVKKTPAYVCRLALLSIVGVWTSTYFERLCHSRKPEDCSWRTSGLIFLLLLRGAVSHRGGGSYRTCLLVHSMATVKVCVPLRMPTCAWVLRGLLFLPCLGSLRLVSCTTLKATLQVAS